MKPKLTVTLSGTSDLILVSAEVHEEMNQHGWCFAEFRAPLIQRPPAENWLGQSIQIQTQDQDGSATIFDGIVFEADLHFDLAGCYNVVVTGVTKSWYLQVTPDQKAFTNLSLPAIASQIGGEDGVPVSVSASNSTPWPYLVQWGVPDMAFLVMRAYERQAWVRATATGLDIKDTFEGGATLKWADRLLHCSFFGRLGASSCSGTYFDPSLTQSQTLEDVKKQPSFLGGCPMGPAAPAASASVPSTAIFRGVHATTEAELRTLLETEAQRNLSQTYVTLITREPRLKIGTTATISGLPGGDCNGPCGILKVVHTWSQAGGYKNEAVGTLAALWISTAAPEPLPPDRVWEVGDRPGLFPTRLGGEEQVSRRYRSQLPQGMWDNNPPALRTLDCLGHSQNDLTQPDMGLISAKVVANNDPMNMGRLRVQYIWADTPTDWIRMASPSAGQGRGILFLPEVGDEVVVSFENGDPNYPIILGSLWNGVGHNQKVREPFSSVASVPNNDIKGIITKSGITVGILDYSHGAPPSPDGVVGLQGSAPQGVVISDNTGEMIQILSVANETNRSIIAITSQNGDIFLGAPNGRVHIRAKYYSEEIG